jgi:hypothetical protein
MMNPTSASSENHFTKGCTFAANVGNRARIARPARKGTPMMRKTSSSICQGFSSTAVSSVRAVGCSDPQNATDSGSTTM